LNEKYPVRCTIFLLAKNYKPTWKKFQGPSVPEISSCVGITILCIIQDNFRLLKEAKVNRSIVMLHKLSII
jgi:hypothetical protein